MTTGSQHSKVKDLMHKKQYMDFIKKVYSICSYTHAQSEVYGTDIIPMVCHNGNIDLEKTVQNVEQVCKYFRMDPSKAKQITDLILWRIERMSRSFSGCLRHDPRHGVHKECKRQVDMGPDGSVELYDALTCITHARNFIGNKPGLFLMAMFPSHGKSRFEIAFVFPSVDGTYNERKARGEIVPRNRWIDKLNTRSAQEALRPDGKDFYVDPEMEFYVRCNSGHTRQVEIQSFGRPLYSEQQKEPRHDEPDYDLPTDSIPPSPQPSRSEAPQEDEGTAQPKHRMRRPAPPSIEEERKIKPFAKKPITFMFHATYGSQLYNIMEHGLKSGKAQSNPSGRMHVHMACIDDVILEDDESEAALTHVPAGRDALLILGFLKDNEYGIRLSEERTALTDQTIEARNIIAAFEPDSTLMASNKWIMKKQRDHEDYEMYDTKIREFADAFFKHVNSTKEKETSSEAKKRRHSTDQDEVEEETMEPSGERSVKPRVIVEYHNPENIDEFIQELKGTYLDTDMNKKDAKEELEETKATLSRFMNKFNKNPRKAHPNLTECERAHWHMSIPTSILEKKNSTSLIKENVPPLRSTSKLNQNPDIRSSFRLD